MSCGVGRVCSLDLVVWLWLLCRLAAAAPIWPQPGNSPKKIKYFYNFIEGYINIYIFLKYTFFLVCPLYIPIKLTTIIKSKDTVIVLPDLLVALRISSPLFISGYIIELYLSPYTIMFSRSLFGYWTIYAIPFFFFLVLLLPPSRFIHVCVSLTYFFSLLISNPLYEYNTTNFFIYLLVDIGLFLVWGYLLPRMCYEHLCTNLYVTIYLQFSWIEAKKLINSVMWCFMFNFSKVFLIVLYIVQFQ